MTIRTGIRILCALIAALTASLPPTRLEAARETFRGETALTRRLAPEERYTFFGLQYLMNRYQKRQYLATETAEGRAAWVERFWADLDPTPSTDKNERRIEHEKRVALARRLFGMKKAPGWDKRGETLIRFGMPNHRAEVEGTVTFSGMTPPGEVWYYTSLDMIVSFQNFNLSGEFIYSIEPIGRRSRRELDRLQNLSQMLQSMSYEEKNLLQDLSPDEVKDLADFNPDEIDYLADPDLRREQLKDLIAAIEAEKREKAINNFYRYLAERPTVYSFELNAHPLPFVFDVTSFDAGGGMVRADVNFEIPAKELTFIQRDGIPKAEADLRVLVRDLDQREIARGDEVITATISGGEALTGASLLPGQVTLRLAPGYYRLGLEVSDRGSKRHGGIRTNVELGTFAGRPAVSDILFAGSIGETAETRRFARGPLQVVPHPLHAYRIPISASFYFEIYGLDTNEEGLAFYRIEYRIDPLTKRRKGLVFEESDAAISSSFETTGFGATQPQHLSIATGNLWEGTFRLTIRVTDRRASRTVERSATFSVIK